MSFFRASLAALLLVAGCGRAEPVGEVTVRVGALALPDVSNAIWKLSISGATGVTWEGTIQSASHGDEHGGITYVVPCDASGGEGSGGEGSIATLELLELVPLDDADWVNPGVLSRSFDCVANHDSSVVFDVTVMRRAHLGFADVAVHFDRVDCAAKFDCVDGAGEPLQLVPNIDGSRNESAVLAIACTADPTEQVRLYTSEATIECLTGEVYTLLPSPDGITWPPGGAPANHLISGQLNASGSIEDAADSGVFVSMAIGFGDSLAAQGAHRGCSLQFRAAATTSAFPAMTIPANHTYPLVQWNVPLTTETGAIACTTHSLFAGPEVDGVYGDDGQAFAFEFAGPSAP